MRKTLRSSRQKLLLAVLKAARKDAGMTQSAVAKKLRRPQSFVAKYENGERRIDVVEFVALARVFGTDPVALLRMFVEGGGNTQTTASAGPARLRGAASK